MEDTTPNQNEKQHATLNGNYKFVVAKDKELPQKLFILPKVTRVEVIQHSEPYNGRAYTKYDAKDVEIQYQDNGKTLKIFVK
jgi:hypothetical protein